MTTNNNEPKVREIVIIGGGLIGVSTAYYLSKQVGLHPESKITLIEEENVGTGSSGYSSGLLKQLSTKYQDDNENQELTKKGFELHQKLAKNHKGELKWGYKSIDLYEADIASTVNSTTHSQLNGNSDQPSCSYSSSSSTASACIPSFLPPSTITSVKSSNNDDNKEASTATAICQPSDLTRHLCGLFLTYPGASLLIAKATSLTFDENDDENFDDTDLQNIDDTDLNQEECLENNDNDDDDNNNNNILSSITNAITSTFTSTTTSQKDVDVKHKRKRKVKGINVIQIINGIEEIVHLNCDTIILSPGIKFNLLLKELQLFNNNPQIPIPKQLEIENKQWETIILKPKEKLKPCAVHLSSISSDTNNEKKKKKNGKIEIIVRDDGKVLISRLSPNQPTPDTNPNSKLSVIVDGKSPSSSSSDNDDLLSYISKIIPKFNSSNGTLTLSKIKWLSPSLERPFFGNLSEHLDVDISGIWFGIGGNTTQGPAIGLQLASEVLKN